MTPRIKLKQLAGMYTISRLGPNDSIPIWADGTGFVTISRSEDELSIVCSQERVPAGGNQDRDWVALKFLGPFAFGQTGIVLSVIRPLSENGIGIFVVSTFDGDHLLVKSQDLDQSKQFLAEAGHELC